MNFDNFTIKSQEIVQKAVQMARAGGNQALEPVHLLKAIIAEGDSVVKFIFQKLDISQAMVERPLEDELAKLPKVNGGEPYLSSDSSKVLESANNYASKNGDQYVTRRGPADGRVQERCRRFNHIEERRCHRATAAAGHSRAAQGQEGHRPRGRGAV